MKIVIPILLAALVSACGGVSSPTTSPTLTRITVSGSASVQVGSTTQFTATATYSDNTTANVTTQATWSSDTSFASVSSAGLVMGIAPGTVQIQATYNGMNASQSLSVTKAAIKVGPFIYLIDIGVSDADQAIILDGLNIGFSYYQTKLGWTPPTVNVVVSAGSNGSVAAFGGTQGITVYTGGTTWKAAASDDNKRKILCHELFHVFQANAPWGRVFTWLLEGSAEYMAYQSAIIGRGVQSADLTRGCMQFSVAHSIPALPSLSQLEGDSFYDPGTPYSLAYLAVEQLVQNRGVTSFLNVPAGFQTAFGVSSSSFYLSFEESRSGWTPPPNFTCIH